MIFNILVHPGDATWEGTKGASGYGAYYSGDMAIIANRYRRFQNAGMNTILPKHYVYHKQSNFSKFDDEFIKQVQYKINRRARKNLEFDNPKNVFFNLLHLMLESTGF